MQRMLVAAALVMTAAVTPIGTAGAAVILSPVSAVIDSSGPGFGTINDTFNQNGLTAGFTSGVTDFDAYLAGNPLHDWIFAGNEWFGNSGTSSAVVTYDLGALFTIDRLALWNEEASGIGLLDLLGSTDGIAFSPLASGLAPTDNFETDDYAADVFAFAATQVRYVRFEMSDCPQPLRDESAPFPACAIGEVAFSSGATAVAEPATLLLLGMGIASLGIGARRRMHSTA